MSEENEEIWAQEDSKTSLEGELEEHVEAEPYSEYIKMLKNNNRMISMALRKAEDLILEYQHDNDELKARN